MDNTWDSAARLHTRAEWAESQADWFIVGGSKFPVCPFPQ